MVDIADVSSAVPAVAGLLTAAGGLAVVMRGPGRRRSRLKIDAEIAAALPESPARERLLAHLDRQIERLIEDETEKTRDLPMLGVAIVVLPALVALTAWLVLLGWPWWLLTVLTGPLCVVFAYGVFETAGKAKRDDRGMRVDDAD